MDIIKNVKDVVSDVKKMYADIKKYMSELSCSKILGADVRIDYYSIKCYQFQNSKVHLVAQVFAIQFG